MAGVHDGHRERLRNRIKRYGFESLEEHEKLEYLLYPFIPRRDTNPIAHDLLSTFGSFKKVLDADMADLVEIKGMTENAALYLHSLPDVMSAYMLSEKEKRLLGPAECAEYYIARIGRKKEEHSLVVYLDDGGHILKSEEYGGSRRSVGVNRDKIVQNAVKSGAKYVVLGHNHPNGQLEPSDADIDATNRIAQALGVVNIKLGDHLIVSECGYYSMQARGDIVDPIDLNGSVYQFAEKLVRRENDINRLRFLKK